MIKLLIAVCISLSAIVSAESKVLAFAGSTREDSVNKKLALEATYIATQLGAEATFIDFKDYPIPFYDGDLEKAGMPENALRLRKLMIESDVIVIASPNYNGSYSAILKNAIDWASRSEEGGSSREAFKGKKIILMSAAPGASGGVRGLQPLRSILENIGGEGVVMSQQITLPNAYTAFDDQGKLIDATKELEIRNLLQEVLN